MSNEKKPMSRTRKMVLDFANVFQTFIGTNYLAVSFAFSQSGVLLGSIGIVIIAYFTAHCCHLIVKCKRETIKQLMSPTEDIASEPRTNDTTAENHNDAEKQSQSRARLKDRLEKHLSYGDVAWVAFGKWGLGVVNFALLLTQIGFCIGFVIFLGNTVQKMCPLVNGTITFSFSTLTPSNQSNSTLDYESVFTEIYEEDTVGTTATMMPTTLPNITNSSAFNPPYVPPSRPRYEVLVAAMVPIFIVFALLRFVRTHLGPVSVTANTTVFLAYIAVMTYILQDFKMDPSTQLIRWETFPIFFGQLTYAYGAIGMIIPIESSMTGNRHLFAPFLYTALTIFTGVVSSIGIMGYMKFGDGTQQIIIWNLPSHSIYAYLLNCVICLGILLTLPITNFPVIEIIEDLLFAEGRIFGPSQSEEKNVNSEISTIQSDVQPLIDEEDVEIAAILKRLPVASIIPDSVSAWKRNLFRASLVCFEAGVAIAFKNEYAYFSAFVGAIGSTLLAYIIPPVIHLKLHGRRLPWPILVKDIIFILFGVVGGVASVFASAVAIFGNF